jgi:putative oxidoreductase
MNDKSRNLALFVFRVSISGFMLFGHGLGKFQKLISGNEIKFLDPFGLGATFSFTMATFAEFFASAFIVLGLFTRFSSLSLTVTMAVAVFIAHAGDPFAKQEKALMYLVSYILLFLTGPGKYSLQTWFDKKISKSNGLIKFLLG